MLTLDQLPIITDIPDQETIRSRLAQLAREQSILRGLLRIARRKQEALDREMVQTAGEGGPPRAA